MRVIVNNKPLKTGVANNFFTRLKGLLGRRFMPAGEALVIYPCNSIHTFFMKFNIDVVFLDKNLMIKRVIRNLKPFRAVPYVKGAYYAVEMAGGTLPEYFTMDIST